MFLNIMPKHTPHSERINAATGIMKSHPTLTAAMAMKLAGFSEEDCSNPSIHALVRRRLPGRSKRAYQKTLPVLSTPSPPDVVVVAGKGGEDTEASPLTNMAASAVVAAARSATAGHSATAAARWQQHGGCGSGGSATARCRRHRHRPRMR